MQHIPEAQGDLAAGTSTDPGRATVKRIVESLHRGYSCAQVESELWLTMHRQEILSKVYVPENDDFAPFGLEQIQHLCRYLAWDVASSQSTSKGGPKGEFHFEIRCGNSYASACVHRMCLKASFAYTS